jgi:hypothetical protein
MYYVGNKQYPSFLIEITKKQARIYQPDRLSKGEPDFYEKYALGKVTTMNFSDIIFLKPPVVFKGLKYVPELIIKGSKYFLVSDKIKELKTF